MLKKIVDGRSYSHEILENYRLRAIELYKRGKKINDIAEFFGVHRCSVSHWITAYKRHGKKQLKSRISSGRPFKLTDKEMKNMIKFLYDDATIFGFETPLWTCKRLKQIIFRETGKKIHETNVMRWLKKWGFTSQKPKRYASQRNEIVIKRWLKEEWPKIREHRRRWRAMLYFQDESGVSLTAVLGKTWAKRGKTPIARTTGNQGNLCITSAISPAGRMLFRIEKVKINSYVHVEFLKHILRQHPNRKVIVVEDRAPSHRAKIVKDFIEKNKKKLAVYLLPPYAPDLNPDEHVWRYLKAYQLKTHQAQTTAELKNLVKRKMHGIQKRKDLIHSFFVGTYVL